MDSQTVPVSYTFEVDVPNGRIFYTGLDPMDQSMQNLVNNALGLIAASQGIRPVPARAGAPGGITASNPRAEHARDALRRRVPMDQNGNGQVPEE